MRSAHNTPFVSKKGRVIMHIKHAMVSCAAILWLVCSMAADAGEIYAITHSCMSITDDDVRSIFLGERQMVDGVNIIPVDNESAQAAFLSKFIKLSKAKYEDAWAKKAFQEGLAVPQSKLDDVEVIQFVKRTPGAISYMVSSPFFFQMTKICPRSNIFSPMP